MSDLSENVPKVFISYSHDSPAHKKWVNDLSSRLMENGIDVILDQWEIAPGDDVPKFMERAVNEADRVLMVCTESYVRKADDGKGGVGYEAMIVTGELVRDLGSSKFIPIIRQEVGQCQLPRSMSTRFYVNMSDGQDREQNFEVLLRTLHQIPSIPKPPLGKSPFLKASDSATLVTADKAIPLKEVKILIADPAVTYNSALEIVRQADFIAWRKLIAEARKPIPAQLAKWRAKYERLGLVGRQEEDRSQLFTKLMDSAAEGVAPYTPLFSIAFAGVASGKEKFNNQVGLLDEMLYPKGWNRSGQTDIADLPETVSFVYQALHGSVCLLTDQLFLAMRLARERIGLGIRHESISLYKESGIIGWPSTLGGNSAIAWDFLWGLSQRWSWLSEIFGDTDDYRAALCAYHMGLNILELADAIADGQKEITNSRDLRLEVPIRFPAMPLDVLRRGYHLLLSSPEQVRNIWTSRKVNDATIKEVWPKWIAHTSGCMIREYPFGNLQMVHERLFDDLSL
jgi:hypothetical protein